MYAIPIVVDVLVVVVDYVRSYSIIEELQRFPRRQIGRAAGGYRTVVATETHQIDPSHVNQWVHRLT